MNGSVHRIRYVKNQCLRVFILGIYVLLSNAVLSIYRFIYKLASDY